MTTAEVLALDAGGTDLLADLSADLKNTATWERALDALISLCQQDFTPLRAVVGRLLRSLDELDAAPDRDLPARQRIRKIVELLGNDRASTAHLAFERVLAPDLAEPMRVEAIRLAASAVEWHSAEALDHLHVGGLAGVLARDRATGAGRLRPGRARGGARRGHLTGVARTSVTASTIARWCLAR